MTVVLLVMGGVALLLVNHNQSRALDTRLASVLAAADDVGDPPPGSYLARARSDGAVELTPGTPVPVADLLTATVRARDDVAARSDLDSVALPRVGDYRVRTRVQAGGQRWVIASDLTALRSEQRAVLQAILFAEAAGVAGAIAASMILSRRSVQPLARALRLQRRFVADASHELRAPLTVLHTRAQILAAHPAVDPSSALGEGLSGLVEDTRALGEVVEDLLVCAELDRHPRRMRQVDLNRIVAAVLEATSAHAHSLAVTLTGPTDANLNPLLVTGHPTALRRAVTALIDNALRHAPTGGHVHIGTADLGDRVELVVADNGDGLDPAIADKVFTRSYHHDHSPAHLGRDELDEPRFGLGLALVDEIAHAHGGSITVVSALGEGARFTLALPRAPNPRDVNAPCTSA